MSKRPDPDWGQSFRRGEQRTKNNNDPRFGCATVIAAGALILTGLAVEVGRHIA